MPLARGGRPVRRAFTGTASRPVPSGTGLELFAALSDDRCRRCRLRGLAHAPPSALARLLGGALASDARGLRRPLACSAAPWPRPPAKAAPFSFATYGTFRCARSLCSAARFHDLS